MRSRSRPEQHISAMHGTQRRNIPRIGMSSGSQRRPTRWWILACTCVLACGDRRIAIHTPEVHTRLIDSLPWRADGIDPEGVLYRVEVATENGRDTIRGITVRRLPANAGDSVLYGFGYIKGTLDAAYRYSVKDGVVATVPLPADVSTIGEEPSLAPSGLHIAYWVFPGDLTAHLRVRSWPDTIPVCQGPSIKVPATDVIPTSIAWRDHREFTWFISISEHRGLTGVTRLPCTIAIRDTISF